MESVILNLGKYRLIDRGGIFFVETDQGVPVDHSTQKDLMLRVIEALGDQDLRDNYRHLLEIMSKLYREKPRALSLFADLLADGLVGSHLYARETVESVIATILFDIPPVMGVGTLNKELPESIWKPYYDLAKRSVSQEGRLSLRTIEALGSVISFYTLKILEVYPQASLSELYTPYEDDFYEFYIYRLLKFEIYKQRKPQSGISTLVQVADIVSRLLRNADAYLNLEGVSFADRLSLFGRKAYLSEGDAIELLHAHYSKEDIESEVREVLEQIGAADRQAYNANDYVAACQKVLEQ